MKHVYIFMLKLKEQLANVELVNIPDWIEDIKKIKNRHWRIDSKTRKVKGRLYLCDVTGDVSGACTFCTDVIEK